MIRRREGADVVFAEQPDEVTFTVDDVDGTIPDALRGAFLKIGPGRLSIGDDMLSFFDGHGMISALVLDGGAARFLCRDVRSKLYEDETAAGRMLRRRVFTNKPGRFRNVLDVRIGDPVAHDVYPFAGRIFAAGDAHYAIEPSSLKTLGRETFGLTNIDKLSPMTKIDPGTDRLITHATKSKPGKPDVLTFVEIDDRLKVAAQAAVTLKHAAGVTHDVAFSQRWYAVVEMPAHVSVMKALSGRGRIWDAVVWPPGERATLHLVPRAPPGAAADGRAPVAIALPPHVRNAFHIVNAYDDGEDVVVDLLAATDRVDFSSVSPPELRARDGIPLVQSPEGGIVRVRARPSTATCECAPIGTLMAEQPELNERCHGLPYRYLWTATPLSRGDEPDPRMVLWWHGVAKIDVTTGEAKVWNAGPTAYVSQTAFAPRAGATDEDDGWLLAWVTEADARRTDVVILDARDPSTGPLARIKLGALFPSASHVRWAPGILPS